jgi:hypothetical protein
LRFRTAASHGGELDEAKIMSYQKSRVLSRKRNLIAEIYKPKRDTRKMASSRSGGKYQAVSVDFGVMMMMTPLNFIIGFSRDSTVETDDQMNRTQTIDYTLVVYKDTSLVQIPHMSIHISLSIHQDNLSL